MKKVPIICTAGLLLVAVAALALLQRTGPATAQASQGQDETLAAQKERIVAAIGRREFAQANAEYDQFFSRFAGQEGLAEAAYEIGAACAEVGEIDSAGQFYDYVIEHWPDSPWAIRSQREIIHAAIKRKDAEATQAALDTLLTDFAQHADIANIVHNLAKHYNSLGDGRMGEKLHTYNVEHYASDQYGLWSQIEIVKAHIADANDPAADAACEKLVTTFASEKSLPHEFYRFGLAYTKAKRPERAETFYRYVLDHWPASPHTAWARLALLDGEGRAESDPEVQAAVAQLIEVLPQQELPGRDIYKAALDLDQNQAKPQRALALHKYNSEHSPKDDQHTVWSLIEVVKAHIRAGNDEAAVQARDTMLTRYADLETLPDIIYLFGDIYIETGQYDKAEQLYSYIEQRWPDAQNTLWSQVGRARSLIAQGNDDQAEAIFQKMMAGYADCPRLVEAVRIMGESYYTRAGSEQRRLSKEGGLDYRRQIRVTGLPRSVCESLEKAVAKFELLVEKWPNDSANTAFAYHFAGEGYSQLGQPLKTTECYEKVCAAWPDYRYAKHLLYALGRSYENLKHSGTLSDADADAMTRSAYDRLMQQYPEGQGPRDAADWLNSHPANEGER